MYVYCTSHPSPVKQTSSTAFSFPPSFSLALFSPDYPCRVTYRGTYTILALRRWPSKLWSLSNYLTSFQSGPRLSTARARGTFKLFFLPEVICLQLGSSPSLWSQWRNATGCGRKFLRICKRL